MQSAEKSLQSLRRTFRTIRALDQGDYQRARIQVMESLTILRDMGDQWFSIHGLEVSARLAAEQGYHMETEQQGLVRAARLFGAAEAVHESLASPLLSLDRRSYIRVLAACMLASTLHRSWRHGPKGGR